MDDINKDFTQAFARLKSMMPGVEVPEVYAQIGSLDQSIIVGDNSIGFSLDKYLGKDYPLYAKYYPEQQRKMMVRQMIVPDCLLFYILSIYPLPHDSRLTQQQCDLHMGKIQWVVNRIVGRRVFGNKYVATVARYMKRHAKTSFHDLITMPIENDLSN